LLFFLPFTLLSLNFIFINSEYIPKLLYRLHDILGDDWKAIIAAHPDGLVFGNHRRAPDMYDPLEIQGYVEAIPAYFFALLY
jgi:hypothetical protein